MEVSAPNPEQIPLIVIRIITTLVLCPIVLLSIGASIADDAPDLEAIRMQLGVDVPPDVLEYQPSLDIPPGELDRNDAPLIVGYCVNQATAATFYTYIYIWTFSDSPWWAEFLGYLDHSWDYEPVIVRVDHRTRKTTYIFDKGHYRAGITDIPSLNVERGTHRFAVSVGSDPASISPGNFLKVDTEFLAQMNRRLGRLAAIPFGPGLSLTWACNDPAKVEEELVFSSDFNDSSVPARTNAFAGIAIGMISVGLALSVIFLISPRPNRFILAALWIGAIGGGISGLVGGFAIESVNGTLGIVMGSILGMLVGALGFIALARVFSQGRLLERVVLGVASATPSAILCSAW